MWSEVEFYTFALLGHLCKLNKSIKILGEQKINWASQDNAKHDNSVLTGE